MIRIIGYKYDFLHQWFIPKYSSHVEESVAISPCTFETPFHCCTLHPSLEHAEIIIYNYTIHLY